MSAPRRGAPGGGVDAVARVAQMKTHGDVITWLRALPSSSSSSSTSTGTTEKKDEVLGWRYKKAALCLHPDKNPSDLKPLATEATSRLNAAIAAYKMPADKPSGLRQSDASNDREIEVRWQPVEHLGARVSYHVKYAQTNTRCPPVVLVVEKTALRIQVKYPLTLSVAAKTAHQSEDVLRWTEDIVVQPRRRRSVEETCEIRKNVRSLSMSGNQTTKVPKKRKQPEPVVKCDLRVTHVGETFFRAEWRLPLTDGRVKDPVKACVEWWSSSDTKHRRTCNTKPTFRRDCGSWFVVVKPVDRSQARKGVTWKCRLKFSSDVVVAPSECLYSETAKIGHPPRPLHTPYDLTGAAHTLFGNYTTLELTWRGQLKREYEVQCWNTKQHKWQPFKKLTVECVRRSDSEDAVLRQTSEEEEEEGLYTATRNGLPVYQSRKRCHFRIRAVERFEADDENAVLPPKAASAWRDVKVRFPARSECEAFDDDDDDAAGGVGRPDDASRVKQPSSARDDLDDDDCQFVGTTRRAYPTTVDDSDDEEANQRCFECGGRGDLLRCDSCHDFVHLRCAGLDAYPVGVPFWACPRCDLARFDDDDDDNARQQTTSRREDDVEVIDDEDEAADAEFREDEGAEFDEEDEAFARVDDEDDETRKPEKKGSRQWMPTPEAEFDSDDLVHEEDANDDECHACGEPGALVCCDTCTRSFHLPCAGLRAAPRGEWACPVCDRLRKAMARPPEEQEQEEAAVKKPAREDKRAESSSSSSSSSKRKRSRRASSSNEEQPKFAPFSRCWKLFTRGWYCGTVVELLLVPENCARVVWDQAEPGEPLINSENLRTLYAQLPDPPDAPVVADAPSDCASRVVASKRREFEELAALEASGARPSRRRRSVAAAAAAY